MFFQGNFSATTSVWKKWRNNSLNLEKKNKIVTLNEKEGLFKEWTLQISLRFDISDESDDEDEERPRKRRMAERAAEGEMEDEEVACMLY